jgi:hypothetical protein
MKRTEPQSISLKHPLTYEVDGKVIEIKSITLRRPCVDDADAIPGDINFNNMTLLESKKLIPLIARLSGVPEEQAKAIDLFTDFGAIIKALTQMLGR